MTQEVIDFLEKNSINYVHHTHPPFFTCEDSDTHGFPKRGAHCKNLFIKSRNSKFFYLYIVPSHKQASLSYLQEITEQKLKFANPDNLKEFLGVTPGSVSFFGLLNDKEHVVELLLDKEIYESEVVNFHPNQNDETLEIEKEEFHKLLDLIGQKYRVIE